MPSNRFQFAIQLIERHAAEDERVEKLRSRILNHLGPINSEIEKLYDQATRFFFTLYPSRYGASDDQENDKEKSVAEIVVANHGLISEEKWFGDTDARIWITLIALDHLEDSLLSGRVIENLISHGDVEDLDELEGAKISVASHMNSRCFETAEILTVADCFALQKKSRRAKAKKGAQKRHETSYKAIRGFIEFYERNGSLSRNEAARRYYRESLADLKPPLYRNEEQAVRALTTGLRKNIGLKN